MDVKIVKVTPELAAQWLKRANPINVERLNRNHIKRLGQQMMDNEFVENGESITFDKNGMLLNGHHRLSAIVATGTTLMCVVATGIEDERAYQTYDSVVNKRTAAQILAMSGLKNNNKARCATAKLVLQWEAAKSITEFYYNVLGGKSPLPQAIVAKARNHTDVFDYINEKLNKLTRHSGMPAVIYGILVILWDIDPDHTRSFIDRVSIGVFENPNDPRHHYRERLLAPGKWGSDRTKRLMLMAMTIKAWNAAKLGHGMKRLNVSPNDPFPNPIGSGKPQ